MFAYRLEFENGLLTMEPLFPGWGKTIAILVVVSFFARPNERKGERI